MFGGLAGIGLIVVAWVSYERRKYRKQFRDRKTAERIRNAVGMRQTVMVRRLSGHDVQKLNSSSYSVMRGHFTLLFFLG